MFLVVHFPVLTIAHDDGSLLVHGFLSGSGTKIVGEEHSLLLRRDFKTQGLLTVLVHVAEQKAHVVPGSVGHLFWVPWASCLVGRTLTNGKRGVELTTLSWPAQQFV